MRDRVGVLCLTAEMSCEAARQLRRSRVEISLAAAQLANRGLSAHARNFSSAALIPLARRG